ncbi:APC family permease [Parasediminibacterium sp. JCM 36343]|uniref:APC family permease n=1 Tax=Parasediminibacterium sp. JCM 36343 TaxID=3374279 RepID=UPI00397C85F8
MSKQQLNRFSLTMIVISLVIGMGIFKTPATIAAKAGTPAIFFAAWVIGGIIALFGALTYAEIGLRLPAIGGYYKIFAQCYHPSIGFTVNVLILISNAASISVVALIGSDYVSDLLFGRPQSEAFTILVAIVPIALFYAVNLLGLHTSSRTQNLLMVAKIGLIVLLISACFTGLTVEPHGYNTSGKIYVYNGHNTGLLLMVSLVSVFFTYGGYQQTINFGGETSSATLQKGIVTGILIVLFLYLAISYAYVKVIGFDKMKNATAIGALLCETWFGKAGGKVFDACMFLSVLAYVNVSLLSNPRVMYAMSKDNVFPKIFAYKNPKTDVMIPGLTAFALTAIVVAFFGKGVDDVLSFSIFLDCIGFCTSAATLLILRKWKQGNENVTGIAKHITPVLCVVFVIAYLFIATAVVIDKPAAAITGILLMFLFLGMYFVFYHKKQGK